MIDPLIQSLLKPEAYPHPVESITLRETHISWVLLTGDYAYKIKKPVDFGFLDFSTLEKRHFYCEEEVCLNQRLAPEIYQTVVAITGSNTDKGTSTNKETSTAADVHIGNTDSTKEPVLEWAVRMTQFDPDATLDVLARKSKLQRQDFQAIGRQLSDFHYQIAAEPLSHDYLHNHDKSLPVPGSPETTWASIQQNFEQIRPRLALISQMKKTGQQLTHIEQWSAQRFEHLEPMIRSRRATGFVRDCHGDLHLQNMAMLNSEEKEHGKREIIFFDCIEFNPNLRLIDVASELAFVLMDLEARGMPEAANTLLNTYLEYSGDFAGLALLRFYQCYRAMVRAKVELLQLSSKTGEDKKTSESAFLNYLQLALSYGQKQIPFIAITHGVSGTGKSTVAADIAATTGAIRLRSDIERKRLYGLAPDESSDNSIYHTEASRKTFKRLQELVNEVINAGYACIVDATFLHQDLRERFRHQALDLGIPFHILSCQAPEAVLVERLQQRAAKGTDASEATESIMRDQLTEQQLLTASEREYSIVLDTTKPLPMETTVKILRR